mmetsp:Transcript_76581/g.175578  ORF Transcript_76581/g.175578 Transcript_76581/m.175578 type:complete len:290 (-) Transcript_76581:22-891(-)
MLSTDVGVKSQNKCSRHVFHVHEIPNLLTLTLNGNWLVVASQVQKLGHHSSLLGRGRLSWSVHVEQAEAHSTNVVQSIVHLHDSFGHLLGYRIWCLPDQRSVLSQDLLMIAVDCGVGSKQHLVHSHLVRSLKDHCSPENILLDAEGSSGRVSGRGSTLSVLRKVENTFHVFCCLHDDRLVRRVAKDKLQMRMLQRQPLDAAHGQIIHNTHQIPQIQQELDNMRAHKSGPSGHQDPLMDGPPLQLRVVQKCLGATRVLIVTRPSHSNRAGNKSGEPHHAEVQPSRSTHQT